MRQIMHIGVPFRDQPLKEPRKLTHQGFVFWKLWIGAVTDKPGHLVQEGV